MHFPTHRTAHTTACDGPVVDRRRTGVLSIGTMRLNVISSDGVRGMVSNWDSIIKLSRLCDVGIRPDMTSDVLGCKTPTNKQTFI